MIYTKKNAAENQKILDQAEKVLMAISLNPKDYALKDYNQLKSQLVDDFPDVSGKRIEYCMAQVVGQMRYEYLAKSQKLCICNYPDGATVAQRANINGHYNEAGGFCCPHYGNTCGHCHQYDK